MRPHSSEDVGRSYSGGSGGAVWDCSLFAKPDTDPPLTGVVASGRDRLRS